MAELIRLDAQDPLPEDRRPHVLVLMRFDDRDPQTTVTEVSVRHHGEAARLVQPHTEDPAHRDFRRAVDAALRYADAEKIGLVYALDRTAGPVSQEVLDEDGRRDLDRPTTDWSSEQAP